MTPKEFKMGQGRPLEYTSKDQFAKTFISYMDRSESVYQRGPSEEIHMVLWRAGYAPGDRLTSWVYSTTCCTVPVYKLLFIRQ